MANEVKLKLAIEGGQVVNTTIDGVTTRIGALDDKARAAASGSDALGNALKGLITVGAAMALIKMADSVTTLQTQLRLSSNSAAEAGKAYGALFDMAQKGRVSFTELGTTYAAVARSGRELGISQDRLLNVTKSISQAMTIGGGSATSMQAALVQLGQGLSSGVLRGEELNSIMEQTPRLAKAIADGLGVPIGKLRELGAAGELTSQQVISALEKAGPALAKEMETATLTVGQAFTMLGNSAVRFVGDADKATGASTTLATAMKSASEAMDTVGTAIRNNETAFAIVTYGLAGPAAAAGVYALSVAIGTRLIPALMGAAAAAGPLGWITIALSAMGGAAVAAGDAFTKSNQGMAISAAQLANQIAAIDRNAAAGLNDRGYKASEEDKRASAARRDELTDKKKLIDQAMNMRTADEGTATAAQNSRRAHSKLMKDAIADRVDFAKAGEAYLTKDQKNQATLNAEIDKTRALFEKGSISAAEYTQRINAVQASFAKAAPSVKGMSDAQKAAAKAQTEAHRVLLANAAEHTKTVDAAIAADEKAHQLVNDQIRTARTMAEQIEFETQLLGMNTEQRALATMERELERQGIVKGTQAYDAYIEKLREAMALKVGKEAGIKAADDLREANKKAAEESGRYWEDALMRAFESGKGFFQSLWDTIKNTLKTQVLKVMVQGTMGTLGLGASGAAMATASGGSGGTDLLGTASTLKNLYSAGSSIVTLGGQVAAGTMSIANALGTMAANATGTGISGLLAANGAYGTAAAGSASAVAGSASAMALAAVPYVAAALVIANGLGLFKQTKRTDGGVSATLGSNASLQTYDVMRTDGSLFSGPSYRDKYNAVDAAASKALSDQIALIKTGAIETGKSLGLVANDISNFTTSLNFRTNGLSAEAIQTKIDEGIAAFGEGAITAAYGSALDAYKREGEAASATLGRLSTSLQSANQWLGQFNDTLLSASVAAADQASKLMDAFGGTEKFATAQAAYYQAMYTDAQRLADTTANVAKGLALVNVAMPTTLEAYNKLRNEQDLMTESGRNAYTVMTLLGPEFAQVASAAQTAADASAKLVTDVFDTLEKRLTSLVDSIASERDSVASARDSILNGGPKTYAELQAGVAAAKVALPSDAGVLAAMGKQTTAASLVATRQTQLASAQASQAWWSTATANTAAAKDAAQVYATTTLPAHYKSLANQLYTLARPYDLYLNKTAGAVYNTNDAYQYNASTNRLAGYAQITQAKYSWSSGTTAFKAEANKPGGLVAQLSAGNAALAAAEQQIAYQTQTLAANTQALAISANNTNTASNNLAAANAAKTAADATVKNALLVYADAMTKYSGDAEKAVKVLSKLREETVAYYEAQKEVAGVMVASAANLRSAAIAMRNAQLGPVQSATRQQAEFAKNYSLALATSGAEKAGYADKLTAALPGLSDALQAVSSRQAWELASARLAAQSLSIANSLDASAAGMSYEAESLGLLSSIDMALGELDTNTAILKSAIDSGTNATAANLRVIAARLGGVPAFAGGGYHAGGLRLVGENGPELEVTGPSRIFNASQLAGPGNTEALVAEIRALRKEVAELRQSNTRENTAIASHAARTADATRRMDANGVLVYTDPAEPLKTQVAA